MATGTVVLPIPGGIAPDGSGTVNNPARPEINISSAGQTSNAPKVTTFWLLFAGATADEHWEWQFQLPGDYASGGTLRLKWGTKSTSTNGVTWKAATAINVTGTTDQDAVAYDTVVTANGTPSATQGILTETTLTLTMTNAAANRLINIMIGRDQDNGSDTNTNDACLVAASFEYTTT